VSVETKQYAVNFRLATGPIIRPSANYDHFFLLPNVPLYKSMVVGSDNYATVPLLRITSTFSGPECSPILINGRGSR